MIVSPKDVTAHPGARITFSCDRPISTLPGAQIMVYFPSRQPELALIHATNNTFSYVIPPEAGLFEVSFILEWRDGSEADGVQIRINPAQAQQFTITLSPTVTPTGEVFVDIYNPLGSLVESAPMVNDGVNYKHISRPGPDWIEGIYSVFMRDDTGTVDSYSFPVERAVFAAQMQFFTLPLPHRQMIEYLKYEMMGDTDPLPPGAFFTLEEYAKHWRAVTEEINNLPPYTNYRPEATPIFWLNVQLKGTLLRCYHALANRGVTVPRWTGMNDPIQDESHYQQSWEQRYNLLRPEYVEERAYMKAAHLPGPAITVDPWMGWAGGSLAGTSGLAMIGHPTWFSRPFGIR